MDVDDVADSSISVVTANNMGRTTTFLNEINELFIKYCNNKKFTVLDIGCAYGVASLEALCSGVTVIANDIDETQLNKLSMLAQNLHPDRLIINNKVFPNEMDFDECSLGAVHASNLLNFLTGNEIEIGVKKIFNWLIPGGKVFIISGSPYASNIQGFIPEYENRKKMGVTWPGECEKLALYSNDPTLSELPESLHLLDPTVLNKVFSKAGFIIEECKFIKRKNTPEYIQFDGRENVMLIARKNA